MNGMTTPPTPVGHETVEGSGANEDALRRIVALEEMVARTHERAAELYESWLDQVGPRLDGLADRARRHRERAAATRSVERRAERTLQRFEAWVGAGVPSHGKARSLVALAALARLRRLLDARIEELVAVGRREGASWTDIGAALHVTRQTAHERYRRVAPDTSGPPDVPGD